MAPGGGGLWRKNRRPNADGSRGVDLNRNYPFEWGHDNTGSSPSMTSETYRGAGPASEPETAAMVNFMAAHDFQTALSVHTYSNLWLAPWGFETALPPGWDDIDEVGTLATEVNGYPQGPASTLLYLANGTTLDHDLGTHGTLCWTPEIGSQADGFWPSQDRIVPLAEDNLLAFYRTALAGGAWVRAAGVATSDAGDGDGSFEPGEVVEIDVLLRNSGTVASGIVDLFLSTASPFASVTGPIASSPPVAPFSDGQSGTPLALTIAPGTPPGTVIEFTVTRTYGGWSQDVSAELVAGERVVIAGFDFEDGSDQGWGLGNPNDASTGEWTRVDPRGTAAQPEDDHTAAPGTRCWVTGQGSPGGSLGENDVDDGTTTLVSPVFDLSNGVAPQVRYWRWYSNDEGSNANDVFEVYLSGDGGSSWVLAELLGPGHPEASGGWFEATLDVDSLLVPTSQMRLRFVASDLGAGSIVEAAIDDVEASYFEVPVCAPPMNYCGTSPNSAGPGAVMSSSGNTDVADGAFTLLASGAIPSQFGLFFYGPDQGTLPIGNGVICIGGAFHRLPVETIDAGGAASHLVDFGNLPNGGDIVNGDTFRFQFWYRDPAVGAGFNFSDGLEVQFCAD
ncbi:MAG: zinc carboxypeptidase [bacterium]|nr:zinc carboxypeptidase [bacterium]